MTITLSNFVAEDSSHLSESFAVAIQSYEVRAETRASSFMAPSLAAYFHDMADNWRGWEGEKRWSTLEGEFELSATADRVGHVRLAFFLRPANTGFHWELRGALELEAGQLVGISESIASVWPA